jgi:hypothetical protein
MIEIIYLVCQLVFTDPISKDAPAMMAEVVEDLSGTMIINSRSFSCARTAQAAQVHDVERIDIVVYNYLQEEIESVIHASPMDEKLRLSVASDGLYWIYYQLAFKDGTTEPRDEEFLVGCSEPSFKLLVDSQGWLTRKK